MARTQTLILVLLYCSAGGLTTGASAQQSAITVLENGVLAPQSDGTQLGVLLLTAHGPGWQYVPQDKAQVVRGTGKEPGAWDFTGGMVIPGTDGGVVQFEQSVVLADEGLRVEYDIGFPKPMTLNGLQVSLRVPTAPFVGGNVAVLAEGVVHDVELPEEPAADKPELLKLEFETEDEPEEPEQAPVVDVDEKVFLTINEAAGVIVQDLRPYGADQYEVRIFVLAEYRGHTVTADDHYSIKFAVSLPGDMSIVGP